MCWSFPVSVIFALLGLALAAYLAIKKESKFLWIPLGYFGIMEALQALSYLVIGDCASSANQLLTFLSYIHISFQPIFVNALLLYFIPERFRRKIIIPVFAITFVLTVIMLVSVYPFEWAGSCQPGSALCGNNLCTTEGNWHLAWSIPLNSLSIGLLVYFIGVILLPLIYGSWRLTLFGIITGPVLGYILTSNPNEWPAVWCLWSVAIILAILIPWTRKHLHVRKWYFWEYPHKCMKCKRWWIPDEDKRPKKCPKCRTLYWDDKEDKAKKKKKK